MLVGTAVLVACGGGESGEESSDGSSAAAVSESSVVDLTTTTEVGFDSSTLEGPIALESSACGGGFDDAALAGVDSVEEAVAALEQSGFDTTAVICAMDPDGGNLRQVSAPGHEARYPGFTDDGESLYWFDVTDESWIVARADGTDPQPWESTTDFPWRRSPDGASYTNTSWGESGFFVTKTRRAGHRSKPTTPRGDRRRMLRYLAVVAGQPVDPFLLDGRCCRLSPSHEGRR